MTFDEADGSDGRKMRSIYDEEEEKVGLDLHQTAADFKQVRALERDFLDNRI